MVAERLMAYCWGQDQANQQSLLWEYREDKPNSQNAQEEEEEWGKRGGKTPTPKQL